MPLLHPYPNCAEKMETQERHTQALWKAQACLEFLLNKILMEKSSIRLISPFLPRFCVARTIAKSMPCISIVNSLLASCWISYAGRCADARCTENPIIQWIFTRSSTTLPKYPSSIPCENNVIIHIAPQSNALYIATLFNIHLDQNSPRL